MFAAVYNSRIRKLSNFRLRLVSAILLFGLATPAFLMAGTDNLTSLEQQLAAKIAGVTGPGAVSVEVVNLSSFSGNEVDQIRQGLLTQMEALGLHAVASEQAAASIKISLSQDPNSYVWVAEIRQGTNEQSVTMVSMPRSGGSGVARQTSAIALRKAPIWSSEDRILDLITIKGTPAHMATLYPEQVTLYSFRDGRWQPEESLAVKHDNFWPRDLRGRLVPRKDHLFDAYLPGVFCQSTAVAPLALNCRKSDDPWPIGTEQFSLSAFFAPSRNFFTGALSPGVGQQRSTAAFYSAAPVQRDNYTLWLFTGLDGQVHLLDGVTDLAAKLGWGSDIASVWSACGTGRQILATGTTSDGHDTVQAFELPDREPVAVGSPVEFSGGVTGLWTEADGSGAVAVSQDGQTGRYEAFRLSIACGQ